MANTSRINGFRPVKHLNGSPYNGQYNVYEIVAGDPTATMVGDLVKADAGTATDVYPTCVRHGTTGEVSSGLALGVIVGFLPFNTLSVGNNPSLPVLDVPLYRAASTKRFAMVADSPDLIFEVEDGGTVPCTLTLIGMNTNFMATAGSTTTGISGMSTGTTVPDGTNSRPLKVMAIVNRPDNASAATSQKLLVMINQHYYMGGQTGT